jgi:hypothetical protein
LQLQNAIVQEKTWYAVASEFIPLSAWESNQPTVSVNSGASATLSAAVSAVDASYNSSRAITFMGSEARNENI